MARYDVVLYGASGFTGQFCVEYLARGASQAGLSWAVAGRDRDRLATAVARAGALLGRDLSSVAVIVADSSDQASLLAMAVQARLVINCVGPYRFFGEPVVAACVEAGAHHLDISGEPQFLERVQLNYHQAASEAGVYVIGSCGFDSVPADLGGMCVKRGMGGEVNSVETFLKVTSPDLPGPIVNFATYQSAIHGFAAAGELGALRRQLFPTRLPRSEPRLVARPGLHHSKVVGAWCLPFMGSDKSVMTRTQRALHSERGARPSQIQCYVMFSSLLSAILLMLVGAVFGLLAGRAWGRRLLERWPGLFTLGRVSRRGVPKEIAENTNFELRLEGEGWAGQTVGQPDRRVTTVVAGKNIGYGATCELVVQAAVVLLTETERIPGPGGVLTPGFAFADTSLVQRLNERDVTFTTTVRDV